MKRNVFNAILGITSALVLMFGATTQAFAALEKITPYDPDQQGVYIGTTTDLSDETCKEISQTLKEINNGKDVMQPTMVKFLAQMQERNWKPIDPQPFTTTEYTDENHPLEVMLITEGLDGRWDVHYIADPQEVVFTKRSRQYYKIKLPNTDDLGYFAKYVDKDGKIIADYEYGKTMPAEKTIEGYKLVESKEIIVDANSDKIPAELRTIGMEYVYEKIADPNPQKPETNTSGDNNKISDGGSEVISEYTGFYSNKDDKQSTEQDKMSTNKIKQSSALPKTSDAINLAPVVSIIGVGLLTFAGIAYIQSKRSRA